MRPLIRRALATDASAIGQLASEFASYLHDLGDPTDFKLTAEAYRRDGWGHVPAFSGIVAENDEQQVIGYLLYYFGYDSDRARRNLHIVDLYVAQGARRQGVGIALMRRAANIAREQQADELIWSVYSKNEAAKRFYAKVGAEAICDVEFMRIRTDSIG